MDRQHEYNEKVMFMLGEIKETLKSVEAQTMRTNGRVTSLENRVEKNSTYITTWKTKVSMVYAGISIICILGWEIIKEKIFK